MIGYLSGKSDEIGTELAIDSCTSDCRVKIGKDVVWCSCEFKGSRGSLKSGIFDLIYYTKCGLIGLEKF